MKICNKIFLTFIAALSLAASCTKDSVTMGSDATMAFVNGDNQLLTDTGLTYNVISAPSGFNAGFGSRVWVECDIEDCLDEENGLFNVKVTGFQIPICSATVDTLTTPFDTSVFKDAIHVNNAWLSGGYLNMYCTWLAHKDSGIAQETSLLYCGAQNDTLNFSLVHNCNGDGYHSTHDQNISNIVYINKMTTFPVQDFIPDGNAVIKLSWLWHKYDTDGQHIIPATEEQSATYTVANAL